MSSRIGFTTYIEEGECTPRSIPHWLSLSHASQENVRCVMGYIVNLTVILDVIFRTGTSHVRFVPEEDALKVIGAHIRSGRRDSIHQDIRSFVARESIRFAVVQKDLVFEKIIDLIRKYCD